MNLVHSSDWFEFVERPLKFLLVAFRLCLFKMKKSELDYENEFIYAK